MSGFSETLRTTYSSYLEAAFRGDCREMAVAISAFECCLSVIHFASGGGLLRSRGAPAKNNAPRFIDRFVSIFRSLSSSSKPGYNLPFFCVFCSSFVHSFFSPVLRAFLLRPCITNRPFVLFFFEVHGRARSSFAARLFFLGVFREAASYIRMKKPPAPRWG